MRAWAVDAEARKAQFERRTIMDGDRVIEVQHVCPAWIVFNPEGDYDAITFEVHMAHVFTEWTEARDTVTRLKIGYPNWVCESVRFTEAYRAKHAGISDATLALQNSAQQFLLTENSAEKDGA